MKKFVKLAAVFAALVLALSGFVACSSDSDDDSGSVVAVYKDENVTTATFYGNGTFEAVMEIPSLSYTEKEASGTYTGDPSQDGDITMTYEYINGYEYNNGTDDGGWYDIELNKPVKVTITNGKCEIMGDTYTRQN